MEIYTYESTYNSLMNVIYAVGAVGFAVLLIFIVKYFISISIIQLYKKTGTKFPLKITVFFSAIFLVPLILSIGFGALFVKNVSYELQMKNGEAIIFEGDPIVISCEEVYYRGDFMGYKVELQIEDKTISPSNTFSKDIVTHFESEEELTVQYGIIENYGLYVWNVKTTRK